ncbi:hypothetical protein KCU59_g84, partial [Aureobasidium melanogenum]
MIALMSIIANAKATTMIRRRIARRARRKVRSGDDRERRRPWSSASASSSENDCSFVEIGSEDSECFSCAGRRSSKYLP